MCTPDVILNRFFNPIISMYVHKNLLPFAVDAHEIKRLRRKFVKLVGSGTEATLEHFANLPEVGKHCSSLRSIFQGEFF